VMGWILVGAFMAWLSGFLSAYALGVFLEWNDRD
jgi:hypothetical protein